MIVPLEEKVEQNPNERSGTYTALFDKADNFFIGTDLIVNEGGVLRFVLGREQGVRYRSGGNVAEYVLPELRLTVRHLEEDTWQALMGVSLFYDFANDPNLRFGDVVSKAFSLLKKGERLSGAWHEARTTILNDYEAKKAGIRADNLPKAHCKRVEIPQVYKDSFREGTSLEAVALNLTREFAFEHGARLDPIQVRYGLCQASKDIYGHL